MRSDHDALVSSSGASLGADNVGAAQPPRSTSDVRRHPPFPSDLFHSVPAQPILFYSKFQALLASLLNVV